MFASAYRWREGDLLTIGEKLKDAREEKHLTLKEIQENIKIRTRYLEALESDQFDVIPGEAYIRAFIKGYANFLDLNYLELLEQYETLRAEEKREIEKSQGNNENVKKPSNLIAKKKLISSINIAVIIVVIVFLIYNIFLLNDSKKNLTIISNNNDSIQAVTDDINQKNEQNGENINNNSVNVSIDNSTIDNNKNKTINEPNLDVTLEDPLTDEISLEETNDNSNEVDTDETTIDQNLKDNIEKIEENNDLLSINEAKREKIDIIVTEKSWIQIHIDDVKVFEGTLNIGDNKSYTYSDNISIKIGNAAGITVRRGNRVLGPWGEQGEVIKKIIKN